MAGRLIEHDRESGVSTIHHYDHQTKETTIETVQDVAPILDHNKAIQNESDGAGLTSRSKQQIKKGWWHVASIPIGVQYLWLKDYGVNVHDKNHREKVKQLLNSPDWRYLRTNTGRL